MTTHTEGVMFVGKAGVRAERVEGIFKLTLNLIDSQGPHKKEPYTLHWIGDDAEAFYVAHKPFAPGDALHVVIANPRAFASGRTVTISGAVELCERTPRLPSPASAMRASHA